ncbi:unnamed protein product [Candidula unifasciata]|uniref:Uncharacterized protein n=1 Tax=Candidula unifasciata TaxID=100452 RepID=A0A8S3YXU6_9EUPU|nr:unnamed protein product [Candidula unifasciata]
MFVSAVAPTGDKSRKDSDFDIRKTSVDIMPDSTCGTRHSEFVQTIKYPVILMNLGGIYVPSMCVCEKDPCFHNRAKSNSRDLSDSDSNNENVDSVVYVQCMKRNCLGEDASFKRCPDDDSILWAMIKKVASILMIICHLTNSIRYIFVLRNTSDNEDSLVISLTNYFILTSFFYLLILNSHACLKHFTSLLSAVMRYERKYGFKCRFKKSSKHYLILFCLVIAFQFAQGTALIYGILSFSDSMSPQLWPLTHLDGVLRFFGALIVGIGVFFAGCNLYGAHFFRAIVTAMLQGEFQRLTTDLSSILLNANDNSCLELMFDQFMEKFNAACDVMNKGYNTIKHTVAAGYIFGIPILCIVLFALVKHSIQLDHYLVLSVNTVTAVIVIIHTTWTLGRLRSQIKSVCCTVYVADWSSFSPQVLQKVLLFTNMYCTNHFGMTVYGIFVVDWSTILAVGGMLLAYSVLLIHLELGLSSHLCHKNNATL